MLSLLQREVIPLHTDLTIAKAELKKSKNICMYY
jgi:hypothetical protein